MSNNEPTITIALDELSKLQAQINELSTDPQGERLAELRHRRHTLVKALSSLLWATSGADFSEILPDRESDLT